MAGCTEHRQQSLIRLGLSPDNWDILVALAGNPNVGKSTVFNALTGLRQHTGNWPGKTIVRAEGAFAHRGSRVKLVDLPGTYSLQAGSADEEVARDFVLFGRPDVTVVVVDATRLERNLNLTLQILDITDRVVLYLNLMDEARRHGIAIDASRLEQRLGVPVVGGVARTGDGIDELIDAAYAVATGERRTTPYRVERYAPAVEQVVTSLATVVEGRVPGRPQQPLGLPAAAERGRRRRRRVCQDRRARAAPRWGGVDAGDRGRPRARRGDRRGPSPALGAAGGFPRHRGRAHLRGRGGDRVLGADAGESRKVGFDFDRRLDRLLTSRWLGFPLMLAVLAAVFWVDHRGGQRAVESPRRVADRHGPSVARRGPVTACPCRGG